jgi:hypothetical protein
MGLDYQRVLQSGWEGIIFKDRERAVVFVDRHLQMFIMYIGSVVKQNG